MNLLKEMSQDINKKFVSFAEVNGKQRNKYSNKKTKNNDDGYTGSIRNLKRQFTYKRA